MTPTSALIETGALSRALQTLSGDQLLGAGLPPLVARTFVLELAGLAQARGVYVSAREVATIADTIWNEFRRSCRNPLDRNGYSIDQVRDARRCIAQYSLTNLDMLWSMVLPPTTAQLVGRAYTDRARIDSATMEVVISMPAASERGAVPAIGLEASPTVFAEAEGEAVRGAASMAAPPEPGALESDLLPVTALAAIPPVLVVAEGEVVLPTAPMAPHSLPATVESAIVRATTPAGPTTGPHPLPLAALIGAPPTHSIMRPDTAPEPASEPAPPADTTAPAPAPIVLPVDWQVVVARTSPVPWPQPSEWPVRKPRQRVLGAGLGMTSLLFALMVVVERQPLLGWVLVVGIALGFGIPSALRARSQRRATATDWRFS